VEQGGFTVIRTDVVRKELAGIDPRMSARSSFDEGIYSRDWTARTYTECRRRTEELLADGERVLVDGSFGAEGNRREFLAVAERLCVPSILLLCQVNAEVAEERIGLRRGDASDADQYTYRRAAENWQPIGPFTRRALREVSTAGTREESLARAVEMLRREGLIN
jgi:predicted kinase